MVFIETSLFSKLLPEYLNDDEYRDLQTFLLAQPSAGAVIRGTGGLRKMRWSAKGRGKRGGVRVIYYFYVEHDRFFMLTLYAKNEVSDLSADERAILKTMVEQMKYEQA